MEPIGIGETHERTVRHLVEQNNRLAGAIKDVKMLPENATSEQLRDALNKLIQALKG